MEHQITPEEIRNQQVANAIMHLSDRAGGLAAIQLSAIYNQQPFIELTGEQITVVLANAYSLAESIQATAYGKIISASETVVPSE